MKVIIPEPICRWRCLLLLPWRFRGRVERGNNHHLTYDLTLAAATSMVSVNPLLRRLVPRYVTTTVNLSRAMIQVAASGYPRQILETDDINRLAAPVSHP